MKDINNEVVDKKAEVLAKDVPFDEEEAYFELCQIISVAQQTANYARFQNDLAQWKKHYPIESFSEKYKAKIRYMLSEKFLDSVLKDYLAFEKYSQMDPNKQLDRLRKIYSRAEKHKDAKKLDADLAALYKEYPLSYLKEKFPHIVGKLTSKSNRERVLQKFDSREAYDEFTEVIYNTESYSSLEELEKALEPLRTKYPVEDFSEEYRDKITNLLKEDSLKKLLEEFSLDVPIDMESLNAGTVITLPEEHSLTSSGILNQKTAYFELLEIMKNPNNTNAVFDWSYKYMKYIGRFDDYHKGLILTTLAPYYKIPKQQSYMIPIMDSQSHDYLSFGEYQSIDDIKKNAVLQYLALISTTGTLSNDDILRLETIHDNSIKAQAVDAVAESLELFAEKSDNTLKLELSDPKYFGENAKSSSKVVAKPDDNKKAPVNTDYVVDTDGVASVKEDVSDDEGSAESDEANSTSISIDLDTDNDTATIEVERTRETASKSGSFVKKEEKKPDKSENDKPQSKDSSLEEPTVANIPAKNSKEKKQRYPLGVVIDYGENSNNSEVTIVYKNDDEGMEKTRNDHIPQADNKPYLDNNTTNEQPQNPYIDHSYDAPARQDFRTHRDDYEREL